MPDTLSMRETTLLGGIHFGDTVFLSIPTYEPILRYDEHGTGSYGLVPQGEYIVGNWAKINGIDVIQLGQSFVSEGRALMKWYSLPPDTNVYLLKESWQ